MIVNTLIAFSDFVKSQCGVNCTIGDHDSGPNEYPLVIIQPDKSFNIGTSQTTMNRVIVPVTVRIIADRKNELEALAVLETLIQKINQFESNNGHAMAESGGEMTYSQDSYEISLVYNLKIILP